MNKTLFYAKVLLFGEYGIISDAKGLSIPYLFYKGRLVKNAQNPNDFQKDSNLKLRKFADYLENLQTDLVRFDGDSMSADLQKGMYFDSDIPQGYGVGSSGALVAAFMKHMPVIKLLMWKYRRKNYCV